MPQFELPQVLLTEAIGAVETANPFLVNRSPAPGDIGIPVGTDIAFEIVAQIISVPSFPMTDVYIDGVLAVDGGVFQAGFSGSAVIAEQSLLVIVDPDVDFDAEALVIVRVVTNVAGGDEVDESWSFTTEDLTPPEVVRADALGENIVRVTFDEDIALVDALAFAFVALDVPAVPITALAATVSGAKAFIEVDDTMSPGRRYEVDAAGAVKDLSNNVSISSTAEFAGFQHLAPEGRSFSLDAFVPRHWLEFDDTGDFRTLLDIIQEVSDVVLGDLDRFRLTWEPDRAPAEVLPEMLCHLGNPFSFPIPEAVQRQLAVELLGLYQLKGTATGMEQAILILLGLVATVDGLRAQLMELGVSELGVDWILDGDEPEIPYSFTITVTETLSEDQRRWLTQIADVMKPAHTHLHEIIEDVPPLTWILGISTLGQNTTL